MSSTVLPEANAALLKAKLAFFEAPTEAAREAARLAVEKAESLLRLENELQAHLARVADEQKAAAELEQKQVELASIQRGIAEREASITVHVAALLDAEREAHMHIKAIVAHADENVGQFAAARRLASSMGTVALMQRPPRSESACRHEIGRLIGAAHLTQMRANDGALAATWLQPDLFGAAPPRRVVRGPNPPAELEPEPPEPDSEEPAYSDELCEDTWGTRL